MKKKISFFYKILIVIMCGIGLYLNFTQLSFKDSIVYFTLQSNILVFVFYFVIVLLESIKKLKKNDLYYIFKGMATMAITLTMLVYQFVITKNGGGLLYQNHQMACNFVHLIVPIMVILDYIIFGEKGHLKNKYPFIWSIILIFYIIFDFVYVGLGGIFANGKKYPYFYMDIDKFGIIGVILICSIIYIIFLGYGFLVKFLDNKLEHKNTSN